MITRGPRQGGESSPWPAAGWHDKADEQNLGKLVVLIDCHGFRFYLGLPDQKPDDKPAVVTCRGHAAVEVFTDHGYYTAVIRARRNPLLHDSGFEIREDDADISTAIANAQDRLAENFFFYYVAKTGALTRTGRHIQQFVLDAVYGGKDPSEAIALPEGAEGVKIVSPWIMID